MKDIQDLLLESEQLRVDSDTDGPQVLDVIHYNVISATIFLFAFYSTKALSKSHPLQVEIEYWKNRAAKLTLLVEQINSQPCKMTLVTLRAANCKLLKVLSFSIKSDPTRNSVDRYGTRST